MIEQYAEPPLFRPRRPPENKSEFQTNLMPVFSDTKRNGKNCYIIIKKQNKSSMLLQCTVKRNIFTVVKVMSASEYGMTKSSMKRGLI